MQAAPYGVTTCPPTCGEDWLDRLAKQMINARGLPSPKKQQ